MDNKKVDEIIKKHNELLDSMTPEEKNAYYERYGFKKINTSEAEIKYDTTPIITDFNVDWKKIKAACMTTIRKAQEIKNQHQSGRKNFLFVSTLH